ncbi:TPA: hypothetical protein EYP13_00970 [Candidatus Micrarchaeota archaeon]|nr:hypothetical protein [Candidatus Micrarchaeota archaeon]
MNKVRLKLLVLLGLLTILFGCSGYITFEFSVTITSGETVYLDEGYYGYTTIILPEDHTHLVVDVKVQEAPIYGFEVWLMTEYQFDVFRRTYTVSTIYKTVIFGDKSFTVSGLNSGEKYVLVFENGDFGWVLTDNDGENDRAVFTYFVSSH